MSGFNDVLALVRVSAKKKRLFTPHALRQMSMPHRMITTNEVRKILLKGEIIEDYTDDPRGHSCLMLGFGEENRPIHVVCSPKEDYMAVITHIYQAKMNGKMIIKRGDNHEVCSMQRAYEKRLNSITY